MATKNFGRMRRARIAAGLAPAEPQHEVIDAPVVEVKPQRVINVPGLPHIAMPPLRAPDNLLSWIFLASALILMYVSVLATDIFLRELFGSVPRWVPYAVQIGFSAVERYLFVGVKNAFTIGVLLVDAVINAAGLFIDWLPRLFQTSVWSMLQNGTGLDANLSATALMITAIMLGILLAWSNDHMFSLAMSAKR